MVEIVFDFELTAVRVANTPKTKIVIAEIKDLIYQRLNILQNEMSQHDGRIIVNVLGTLPGYPLGIGNEGYPPYLQKKISESITEQDIEYAYNRMLSAFENL